MLADLTLAIDGVRIPISVGSSRGRNQLVQRIEFGVPHRDVSRLASLVGRTGAVHSRGGAPLFQLRIDSLDADLSLIKAEVLSS